MFLLAVSPPPIPIPTSVIPPPHCVPGKPVPARPSLFLCQRPDDRERSSWLYDSEVENPKSNGGVVTKLCFTESAVINRLSLSYFQTSKVKAEARIECLRKGGGK